MGRPCGGSLPHLCHLGALHGRLRRQALQPPLQRCLDHVCAGLGPGRLAGAGPGGGHRKVLGAKGRQGAGAGQGLQLALGVASQPGQLELLLGAKAGAWCDAGAVRGSCSCTAKHSGARKLAALERGKGAVCEGWAAVREPGDIQAGTSAKYASTPRWLS